MKVYLMFRGEYEGRYVEGAYVTRARAEAAWRALQAAKVAHWRSFNTHIANRLAKAEALEEPDIEEHDLVE